MHLSSTREHHISGPPQAHPPAGEARAALLAAIATLDGLPQATPVQQAALTTAASQLLQAIRALDLHDERDESGGETIASLIGSCLDSAGVDRQRAQLRISHGDGHDLPLDHPPTATVMIIQRLLGDALHHGAPIIVATSAGQRSACIDLTLRCSWTANHDGEALRHPILGHMVAELGGQLDQDADGFTLLLPLPAAPEILLAGQRVLIADDDRSLLDIYRRMIIDLGGEATCVTDGQAAVDHCLRASVDLVLMDLDMPILDGCSAIAALREAGLGEAFPIIAMTAKADENVRAQAVANGARCCLRKPLSRQAIIDSVGGNQHSPAQRAAAVFDATACRQTIELMGNDLAARNTLRALVDDYRREGPAMLADMQDALSNDLDFARVESIAHNLKSRSAALGLQAAAAAAAALEIRALHRDLDHTTAQDLITTFVSTQGDGLLALRGFLTEETPG